MNDISSGKLRGIMKLADANGRFKMMAIDQRGSMGTGTRRCTQHRQN